MTRKNEQVEMPLSQECNLQLFVLTLERLSRHPSTTSDKTDIIRTSMVWVVEVTPTCVFPE